MQVAGEKKQSFRRKRATTRSNRLSGGRNNKIKYIKAAQLAAERLFPATVPMVAPCLPFDLRVLETLGLITVERDLTGRVENKIPATVNDQLHQVLLRVSRMLKALVTPTVEFDCCVVSMILPEWNTKCVILLQCTNSPGASTGQLLAGLCTGLAEMAMAAVTLSSDRSLAPLRP
jgi:hypothetical protein